MTSAMKSAKRQFLDPDSSREGGFAAVGSKKKVESRNQLNDLGATEWIGETVSVWVQRGLGANHVDARIERQHPAPFSFTDVARLIRFFTKKGDVVLDPFVGVGSTLKACALEGRKGIGFDLNPKYVRLARERLRTELSDLWANAADQEIRAGDARILADELPRNFVDFLVTSPPYWNILHKEDHKVMQERKRHQLETRYGDDRRDLGNIPSYKQFVSELSNILIRCANALKPKKYAAVIVSDFRDKSKFVMFHADLAYSLEASGLELRGLSILYQRHKRVFPYGYPFAYVPNIHHQFILILQNAKRA
jgi:DNA modification methylase